MVGTDSEGLTAVSSCGASGSEQDDDSTRKSGINLKVNYRSLGCAL